MGKIKYKTEEERIEAQREKNREAQKRYRERHPERVKQSKEQWKKNNKEKVNEYNRDWKSKNKEKVSASNKRYFEKHNYECLARKRKYYYENREKILKYQSEYDKDYTPKYRLTQKGRARHLIDGYIQQDRKHNRGECTLTQEWIVDNIFSKECHYCGETDWHKLGCDRIDNELPHTPENVVPCCYDCNSKKGRNEYNDYMRLIGKVGREKEILC